MQVGNGFAPMASVIDDDAKSCGVEALLPGQFGCGEEKMSQQTGLFRCRFSEPGDENLGNDEGMKGSLRVDVTDGDAAIILMEDVGRNFAGHDFFKESHLREG